MMIGKFIAIAIIAYLLGAIPFGLIIGRLIGKLNVTEHGSGNIGGTNVLRTVGTKAGALVIVLDLCKAAAAVILAKIIIGDGILFIGNFPLNWEFAQVVAALIAMLGHNWSVFIGFRGGKGVAAYFGGWFVIFPLTALFGAIILVLTVLRTRYMSMGSILGALGVLCLQMYFTVAHGLPPIYLVYSLVAASLIVYQHRKNIVRLQTGTELSLRGKSNKHG